MTDRRMKAEAQTTQLPGMEITKPARQLSFESDFVVPMVQATFTGLVGGSAVAVGGHYLFGAPLRDAWALSVVVGIALAWFWRLAVVTGTLYDLERIAGVDINRDGVKGNPKGHILALNPYKGQHAQRQEQNDGLRNVFAWFVQGCAIDTSSRKWEKEIGREQYQEWRDMLIGSGYAKWRGRTGHGGWDLTADPATVLAALEGADF